MSVTGLKLRIASSAAAAALTALCVALLVAVAPAVAAPVPVLAELPGSASSAATATKTVVCGHRGRRRHHRLATRRWLVDGAGERAPPPLAVPAGTRLVIDAGDGNDQITADSSVTTGIVILAGAGNDQVSSGAGGDYVDAGPGDDVVNGGAGDDVIYGGAGNDVLHGGADTYFDYIDGGPGDDQIYADAANDILIGGAGADVLHGGDGDLLAGGPGVDTYLGGVGDRTYAQHADARPISAGTVTWVSSAATDAAGKAIAGVLSLPKGTKPAAVAFRQRCSSDVQALLSLPLGRRLLLALDAAGRQVSLVRSAGDNQTIIANSAAAVLRGTGARGPGSVSTIDYDPILTTVRTATAQPWMHRPPLVGLYHELIHALNAGTGSLQPGRRRRQASPATAWRGLSCRPSACPSRASCGTTTVTPLRLVRPAT